MSAQKLLIAAGVIASILGAVAYVRIAGGEDEKAPEGPKTSNPPVYERMQEAEGPRLINFTPFKTTGAPGQLVATIAYAERSGRTVMASMNPIAGFVFDALSGEVRTGADGADKGSHTLSFSASGDDQKTRKDAFGVNVDNAPPRILNLVANGTSALESTSVAFFTAEDDEGDQLVLSVEGDKSAFFKAEMIAAGTGAIRIVEGGAQSGSYLLTLRVRDAAGSEAASGDMRLVLNDAPVISDLEVNQRFVAADGVIIGTFKAQDPNGDAMTVRIDGPLSGLVKIDTGVISLSSPEIIPGEHLLTIVAEDDLGATASEGRSILVVTPPPPASEGAAPQGSYGPQGIVARERRSPVTTFAPGGQSGTQGSDGAGEGGASQANTGGSASGAPDNTASAIDRSFGATTGSAPSATSGGGMSGGGTSGAAIGDAGLNGDGGGEEPGQDQESVDSGDTAPAGGDAGAPPAETQPSAPAHSAITATLPGGEPTALPNPGSVIATIVMGPEGTSYSVSGIDGVLVDGDKIIVSEDGVAPGVYDIAIHYVTPNGESGSTVIERIVITNPPSLQFQPATQSPSATRSRIVGAYTAEDADNHDVEVFAIGPSGQSFIIKDGSVSISPETTPGSYQLILVAVDELGAPSNIVNQTIFLLP